MLVNSYNGTPDASDTYGLGTHMVVWTVTDPSGNSAVCTQQVEIIDNRAPVLVCPSNLVEVAAPLATSAFVTLLWRQEIWQWYVIVP